jgi:hypothetical protein
MKRLVVSILAASLGFGAAPVMAGDGPDGGAQYQSIAFEDLPPAVQTAVRQEAGSGVVLEIRKQEKDGQLTYQAEVVNRGKGREVDFSPEGTLLKRVPEYYENY